MIELRIKVKISDFANRVLFFSSSSLINIYPLNVSFGTLKVLPISSHRFS